MILTKNESRRTLKKKASAIKESSSRSSNSLFFLIRHYKSIIFVVYPYLSLKRFLVKCPMTFVTAMNANQQVTKTIFFADSRNSSLNRKPELVL